MPSYTCVRCSEKFSEESMDAIISKLYAHYEEVHDDHVDEEELRRRIKEH